MFEDVRHSFEHLVALLVADGVVDRLEVVEVHHQQAEGLVVPYGAAYLHAQGLAEVSVVVHPGQAVAAGEVQHLLVAAGVL